MNTAYCHIINEWGAKCPARFFIMNGLKVNLGNADKCGKILMILVYIDKIYREKSFLRENLYERNIFIKSCDCFW